MKKNQPEILSFGKEYIPLFMEAIRNVEKRTYISNESIFQKDEHSVEVYDTRSGFLIEVGREYQKLIDRRKPEQKGEDEKLIDQFKDYLSSIDVDWTAVWMTGEAFYATVSGGTNGLQNHFTQLHVEDQNVRLSFNDLNNKFIVGDFQFKV